MAKTLRQTVTFGVPPEKRSRPRLTPAPARPKDARMLAEAITRVGKIEEKK